LKTRKERKRKRKRKKESSPVWFERKERKE